MILIYPHYDRARSKKGSVLIICNAFFMGNSNQQKINTSLEITEKIVEKSETDIYSMIKAVGV